MIRRYNAKIVLEFLYCDYCHVEMRPLAPGWYTCPKCSITARDAAEYPKQTIVRGEELEPSAVPGE